MEYGEIGAEGSFPGLVELEHGTMRDGALQFDAGVAQFVDEEAVDEQFTARAYVDGLGGEGREEGSEELAE
jgi:hypothetical protein